ETQGAYPKQWREAAGETQTFTWLTPQELADLRQEFLEVFVPRYLERIEDPSKRPPGSVPVEFVLFSYPVQLPEQEEK
ncbi:MAG TPA: hypothetical protein VME01_06030, partial [Solirubrobacteraceae bacterium]|nr:hypothetical protein [Solirubrobacteraceae bacterium]